MDWFIVIQALWLFLPAYMANMAPVFAMKLFPRWNARIDGGRIWKDGRPVFGPGKTWRGLVAAPTLAAATALVQSLRPSSWDLTDFGRDELGPTSPLVLGAALGLGAIVGDAVKSFFKRRTGRSGGAPWVPFDQLDFVVGGLMFAAAASAFLSLAGVPDWFARELLGDRWPALVVLLVLTPGLHFLVNIIGYKLKFKQVPW